MNRHLLAALFLVSFLLLAVPLLLMQHSGVASASLTVGLMRPLESETQRVCFVAIGCVAAFLAREMLVLLPLSGLFMLLLGALAKIEMSQFAQVQEFTVGAILLFALAMSMMRHRASLLSIIPIAAWSYFTGSDYMMHQPEGVQPLYFLLGLMESAALLMAIGVAFSMTIMGAVISSMGRLKTVSAIVSFFALF